jgi:hypothetical protein
MRIISHRGNVQGPDPVSENSISSIELAISLGFDVEIDLWFINGKFFLGHDDPINEASVDFLQKHSKQLWIHCKNVDAVVELQELNTLYNYNYFWHESDTITLTSNGYIWAYVGKQPIKYSIAVMPEKFPEQEIKSCFGICTDFPIKYKEAKS